MEGAVTFKDVSFAYPSRPNAPVLKGFNLTVPPNTTAALVGSSGAGKSTVVALLQRFYDVNGGTLEIDGRDIRTLDLQWLRQHIGYVQQEPAVFGLTVRENICYGVAGREVSQEEIESACRKANAHDFIMKWPEGYDTLCGERGVKMSGGQKQRIAIARALLVDPRILLLDEATSSLDAESEHLVQEAIEKAVVGRTVIIVAHRLSTIRRATQIVVLDTHRIIDVGSHDELLQRCSKYQDLIKRQSMMHHGGAREATHEKIALDQTLQPTRDLISGHATSSAPAPAPVPTPSPTLGLTPGPTPGPTPAPTPSPTPGLTSQPTAGPVRGPTPSPTPGPAAARTLKEIQTRTSVEEDIPPVPDGWTRCHAYLSQKRRYCRQLPLEDALYCGNHREHISASKRKRVPCPLDPSHTIYEDMLTRHLKICPKARTQREQEQQPFYQLNVNAGGNGAIASQKTARGATVDITLDQATRMAKKLLSVHQELFGKSSTTTNPIEITQQEIESSLPLIDYSQQELQLGLAEAMESYHIRSGGPKHMQQQASLLGHLKQVSKNENQDGTLLLELGAGRGMLGLVAAGAFASSSPENVDLIMIERAGTRSKADTILRNHQSKLEGRCLDIEQVRNWKRIQCDLAHVRMTTVMEATKSSSVCAIAKHLCGAGTDLALKALHPVRDQISVCMMATCCHGVCTWEHYVGRDCLMELLTSGPDGLSQFGADEFELLRLWSSGTVKHVEKTNGNEPATKKPKQSDDEADEAHSCVHSADPKKTVAIKDVVAALNLRCGVQGLGRVCQRVLDHGRKVYMEKELFATEDSDGAQVELCYYVPSSDTPQNALLLAWRKETNRTKGA